MPAVALDSSLYDWWMEVWLWLLRDNASRTTVLLMVITGIYAYLTWKMAKAIAHQTRATIQPIVSIEFFIEKEESFPKGRFEVKNRGAQPLLLLDMRLECRRAKMLMFEEYKVYERHILPPQEVIRFSFDFTERFRKEGVMWWSPGIAGFNLQVVASDLSEEMVLTYRKFSYLRILTVQRYMPLRVRWKFLSSPFRQWYHRIDYRFHPMRYEGHTPDENRKRNRRTTTRLERIADWIGIRSREKH
jgi:hypothetical protein